MDGLAGGLGVIAGIFFSFAALQTGQRYLMGHRRARGMRYAVCGMMNR
jgi:hypothetical protein